MFSPLTFLALVGLMAVLPSSSVAAATVTNVTELRRALNAAAPGQNIVVANGTYRNPGALLLKTSGTEAKPIELRAETPGGVTFTGDAQFRIEASHVNVSGFRFTDGKPATTHGVIVLKGSSLRLTECSIAGFNVGNDETKPTNWVNLDGDHVRVDHCSFQGKVGLGVLLVVVRNDARPNYHQIDHNVFRDYAFGHDANGLETIRVGTSHQSQSDSYTMIANNYFENCDGEAEIISIKSGQNTIADNTIVNCRGILTLRQGHHNTVTGNVILNLAGKLGCGGIRVCDGPHLISQNYIAGTQTESPVFGGVVLSSSESAAPTDLGQHWPVHDVTITRNSIIDCQKSLVFGSGNYGYSPVSATFERNIISYQLPNSAGRPLIDVIVPVTKPAFVDEIYFMSAPDRSPLPVGIDRRDPHLMPKVINGYTLMMPSDDATGADLNKLHPLQAKDVGPRGYRP